MMSFLFIGRDAFIDFAVSVTGLVLIIPALFWLYFGERIFAQRDKACKTSADPIARILFRLILILLGLLIAPGSSFIIQKMMGIQPYINTMISIPTALVVIYAFIHLTAFFKLDGRQRISTVICLAILIVISSSVFISYDHPFGIKLLSNSKKIDPEVQNICDLVDSDYVMLPDEIYGQIGEYDSGVKAGSLREVPYDKYYAYHVTVASLEAEAPLFVIRKSYDDPSSIEPYYKKTAETEHYVIYRRSD